jgi:Galactose mutarotase and related enzymes
VRRVASARDRIAPSSDLQFSCSDSQLVAFCTNLRQTGEWSEGMNHGRFIVLLSCALPVAASLLTPAFRAQDAVEINGEKVVILKRAATGTSKPEFTSVTVAPGRGMEVLQMTANFPGKGEINVLNSPDLPTMKQMLDEKDTAYGDAGYRFGAAILVPYANRIRGQVAADGKTVNVNWEGHTLSLPGNTSGRQPGAEKHSMHGLILKARVQDVRTRKIAGGEQVTGVLHAGDFGGQWVSSTDLLFTVSLTADAVDVQVTAKNVGKEAEPLAIGWHPYISLPSGDRAHARVHIPGAQISEMDRHDDMIPTGKLLDVAGTVNDWRAPEGHELGDRFFDENWCHFERTNGAIVVKVVDPVAKFGVELDGLSKEMNTVEAYTPPRAKFVAIEHQYNFNDPFGKQWNGMDTGMVRLKPGKSTTWHVRVKVFVP